MKEFQINKSKYSYIAVNRIVSKYSYIAVSIIESDRLYKGNHDCIFLCDIYTHIHLHTHTHIHIHIYIHIYTYSRGHASSHRVQTTDTPLYFSEDRPLIEFIH